MEVCKLFSKYSCKNELSIFGNSRFGAEIPDLKIFVESIFLESISRFGFGNSRFRNSRVL
jgi:hypothetical protein